MYSAFQLAKKYLKYYISAGNGKGHGTHSPFVYDFITHVLNDKKNYDCYNTIEVLRNNLLNNHSLIEVEDFGAGSAVIPFKKRKISAIAKSAVKNKKFAKLLFRIAKYYEPQTIVELGTCFGITTSYLACANKNANVYSFEGSKEISRIAIDNFNTLHLQNIQLIEGNFDTTLMNTIKNISVVDLAFIDGNHKQKPTLAYFSALLQKSTNESVFIFDDIHWSIEMEKAWKEIQAHEAVTLTIDLFFIGIVFFNHDFKVKQHFTIRF